MEDTHTATEVQAHFHFLWKLLNCQYWKPWKQLGETILRVSPQSFPCLHSYYQTPDRPALDLTQCRHSCMSHLSKGPNTKWTTPTFPCFATVSISRYMYFLAVYAYLAIFLVLWITSSHCYMWLYFFFIDDEACLNISIR